VIGSVKPEMHMKTLRNLSEKLAAKFSVTTLGYSAVKIVCLDAFSETFKLDSNPIEGQSLQ